MPGGVAGLVKIQDGVIIQRHLYFHHIGININVILFRHKGQVSGAVIGNGINTGHIGEMQVLQQFFCTGNSLLCSKLRFTDIPGLIKLQDVASVLTDLYIQNGVFAFVMVSYTVNGNAGVF